MKKTALSMAVILINAGAYAGPFTQGEIPMGATKWIVTLYTDHTMVRECANLPSPRLATFDRLIDGKVENYGIGCWINGDGEFGVLNKNFHNGRVSSFYVPQSVFGPISPLK